jgi:inner membrane protein
MRWQYHKLTAGAAIYAVTGGYFPTCLAMIGSIIPDLLEMGIVRHRTVTHWPPPWIILALVSFVACWFFPNIYLYIFCFLCIGALLHLGDDYLSVTGIPFHSPGSPRRGAGMYATGTMGESRLAMTITGPFILVAWFRGFFTVGHVVEEIVKMKSLATLF